MPHITYAEWAKNFAKKLKMEEDVERERKFKEAKEKLDKIAEKRQEKKKANERSGQ